MKLKKFNEFISLNESLHGIEIEEQLFMIDGEIYDVHGFDVDLTWDHQPADPEVGIPFSFDFVEDYEIYHVTNAAKFVNSEIRDEIIDLLNPSDPETSAQLIRLGLKEEASEERISELVYSGDWRNNWKELEGSELKAFSTRFISLYNTNQLKQIFGDFSTDLQAAVDRIDEPDDYDDYDD
jgi:hypothetical protein